MDQPTQPQKDTAAPARVTEFTIDRSKWLRGEGFYRSRLIRPEDGKMCCLGFYGLACGIDRADLLGMFSPDQAGRVQAWVAKKDSTSWLFSKKQSDYDKYVTVYDKSLDCANLMVANDELVSAEYSEEDREKEITKLFANNGVTVHFIDGT